MATQPLTLEQRQALVKNDMASMQKQALERGAKGLDPAGFIPETDMTLQNQIDALQTPDSVLPENVTGSLPQEAILPTQQVQSSEMEPPAPSKYEDKIDQSLGAIDSATAGQNKQLKNIEAAYEDPAYKKRLAERQAKADSIEAKYLESLDAIQKETVKETDPNRYWSSKSTGQKILAGIGLAFGALGAARDGVNHAANIVQNSIKLDVDAQIADKNSRLTALNQQSNTYSKLLDLYKDPELAKTGTMVASLNRAGMLIKGYESKVNNEQAKQGLLRLGADLETQKQNALASMKERIATNVEMGKEYTLEEVNQKPFKLLEQSIVLPNGKITFVKSKEAAAKYDEVFRDSETVKAGLQDLKKLLTVKSKLPWTEDAARVETLMTALTGALRLPLTGPGVLTEEEQKKIRNAIGDPSKLLSLPSQIKAKLFVLDRTISRSLMNAAKSGGFLDETAFRSKGDKKQDAYDESKAIKIKVE